MTDASMEDIYAITIFLVLTAVLWLPLLWTIIASILPWAIHSCPACHGPIHWYNHVYWTSCPETKCHYGSDGSPKVYGHRFRPTTPRPPSPRAWRSQ